jgi:hypothetical protein
MNTLDFTTYAAGAEFEGLPTGICTVCGMVGLPGRRRKEQTMIHKGVLVKGALNITAFCNLTRERPNE